MKILLVYPKYPDTFWSFKHALRFISRKAAFPPLGLLTIASMIPKRWEKKLVDMNVTELTDDHLAWADMVFISAMIVQKPSAEEVIARCSTLGKKVVAGGPVFTTQHENFKGVDHFILNEAEVTLPLFLKDLKEGHLKPVYTSPIRPNVTQTPLPMWSLIRFKDYATLLVQYSRGCPFNCEFCDIIIMNGRIPRTKTPQQMVREFQALYEAGWRGSLFIVDDNFIGNRVNVKKMLRSIVKWQKNHNYPFQLFTEASTDLAADNSLLELMRAANFYKVFLGIETPVKESLIECQKVQNTNRDLGEAVRKIQQYGMQVLGGFIVGFDTDPENIFERQIDFIQKTGVVTAMVGVLTALPQTQLWYRMKKEGRLLGESTGGNTDGVLNFKPKMKKEKLMAGYKQVMKTLYEPKQYYRRIDTFIKNYVPSVKAKMDMKGIIAFLKSMWRIGVLSRARLWYWRLIVRTIVMKRKALPMAVELAITGQHFEHVVKKVMPSYGD
ncbi:MAG: DUF4070 domain-containing protein [Nanoarchaeota archaeon]